MGVEEETDRQRQRETERKWGIYRSTEAISKQEDRMIILCWSCLTDANIRDETRFLTSELKLTERHNN